MSDETIATDVALGLAGLDICPPVAVMLTMSGLCDMEGLGAAAVCCFCRCANECGCIRGVCGWSTDAVCLERRCALAHDQREAMGGKAGTGRFGSGMLPPHRERWLPPPETVRVQVSAARVAGCSSHTAFSAAELLARVYRARTVSADLAGSVAAACLLISSKAEESARDVLSGVEVLLAYTACGAEPVGLETLAQVEATVLSVLSWRVHVNGTVAHYLSSFSEHGLACACEGGERVARGVREYAWCLAPAMLSEPALRALDPAAAAAVVIAAARTLVGVRPPWTARLERLTGYRDTDIDAPWLSLLALFAAAFPDRCRGVLSAGALRAIASAG